MTEEFVMTVQKSYSKSKLHDQVAEVIAYSQNIPVGDLKHLDILMDVWETHKKRWLDAWGGTTYEAGFISFPLAEKDKENRLSSFLSSIYSDYQDLIDFVWANRDTFFENKVNVQVTAPDMTVIKAGSKIVKSFKHFIPETDDESLDYLDRIQTAASMLIQETKLSGILTFSVDPLDYLSVSENASNWRSCHALDGEYRAGNLEYMCDSTTIICYLKSENGDKTITRFPFPWNDKKWRMLLFCSEHDNLIMAGRQYPCTCESALDFILEEYQKAMGLNQFYADWTSQYITTDFNDEQLRDRYLCVQHALFRQKELIKTNGYDLFFNDLIRSSCYVPFYTYKLATGSYLTRKQIMLNIGSSDGVVCPCCGEHMITYSDKMWCPHCANRIAGIDLYNDNSVFEETETILEPNTITLDPIPISIDFERIADAFNAVHVNVDQILRGVE